jgi:IS5 family transposase
VKLAGALGILLRQNYNREAPRRAVQIGCYAHAKQYRCMKATLKSLRTIVGRVWRDIDRKLDQHDDVPRAKAVSILARVKRVLEQKPKDKNKLYRLHAPEVECISKGKARQPYEFGVSQCRWRDNLAQCAEAGGTPSIRKAIHRRSAVEPVIGPMKNEGKLRRNWLKGRPRDALNAVLCGAGHDLRMILRSLRLFYVWILCFAIAGASRRLLPCPAFRRFTVL